MSKLESHPIADLFPPMGGEEFDALVADIKKNGLRQELVLYEDKILDGRNRYRACLAAGIAASWMEFKGDDPAAYVISANIHRRHLTAEQKRELIAKLLKAQPEKSDRQIADTVKASPTTVGTVRTKMEAAGDVSKLDTRTDTKGRQQPASKPDKAPPPEKAAETPAAPKIAAKIVPSRKMQRTQAQMFLEFLIDPDIRKVAAQMVLTGDCQSQFEAARDGVSDLYQRLARAGR